MAYNWNSCAAFCCDPAVIYLQTAYSISQCESYLSPDSSVSWLVIVGPIIGAVVIILIVIICIKKREKLKKMKENVMANYKPV
jgi:hypothetical protein